MTKNEPLLFNVQKAADFLGVNPSTIRQWALAKKLKGVKLGTRGDWRFTKENLLSMIHSDVSTPKDGELGAHGLQEDFHLMTDIVESVHDGLVVFDAKWRYLYINQRGAELAGMKKEDCIGKSLQELHPDGAKSETFQKYNRIVKSGQPGHVEYVSPGTKTWVRANLYPSSWGVTVLITDISDRKEVEEALLLGKAQLQILLDKTPLGVYLIDADFRIQVVNPIALPVFGTIPDLIGRDFDEVIHQLWSKEYADEVVQLFRHTLETGEPYYTPERIEERRDLGVTEYYEWQINRIPLPGGREGVVCYFRDVSAQVHARLNLVKSEEKIRSSEALFKIALFLTAQTVFKQDTQLRYTWIYNTHPKFVEKPILGRTDSEILDKDSAEVLTAIKQSVINTGKTFTGDIQFEIAGKPMVFAARIEVTKDVAGNINGIIAVTDDITERRQAENKIKESEQEMRKIKEQLELSIRAGKIGVWHWDVKNDVLTWSKEQREIYGVSESELITSSAQFNALIVAEDLKRIQEDQSEGNKIEHEYDFRINRKNDGVLRWIKSRARNIFDPQGNLQFISGINIDTTEQIIALNQIEENEKKQTFLLKLSDAIKGLTDPLQIQAEATRRLGSHLGVGRSFYSEVESDGDTMIVAQDYTNGVPSQVGRYSIASFGTFIFEDVRAGRTIVVNDTATDVRISESERAMHAATSVRAFVAVSLKKDGRLASGLSVNQPTPRQWTQEEIQLIEDVAERTWAAAERAIAEEALHKSEEKYRTLLTSIDQGYTLCELIRNKEGKAIDFYMLEVNPTYEEQTGISKETVLGKRIIQTFPSLTKWLETYAAVVDNQCPVVIENYFEDTNRWFENKAYPVGKDRFFVLFSNITERKRREANLAFLADVSDDLVRLTNIGEAMNALGKKIGAHFQASICSFLEIDAERGIGTVTHAWHAKDAVSLVGEYRIADYGTPEQLATWRSGNPFVLRDAKSDERVNGEALATYGIGSYLSIPIARDGEWRYLLSVYDRVARDWSEKEIELMRELTSRIWTRLERARAEESLQKSALQKDEFIGVAAHELKTPVTSIKAYAQVLEHRFRKGGDTPSADIVQKMSMQLDKLTDLISNLLDVTKIQDGMLQLNKERFDSNRLVEEVVLEMQLTTDVHKLTLDLKENKPLLADRGSIGQVLVNLLSNAIKYSPHSTEIVVRSMTEGRNVIISVQDFGPGIPKDEQQKIFERFHKVPGRAKETYPGLGVGLYISAEIIKRHDGRIWVESEKNKGTTFYIAIPQGKT